MVPQAGTFFLTVELKMAQRFEFSDELVGERFLDNWTLAENFLEAWEKVCAPGDGIEHAQFSISDTRMFLAVSSAYQDIARYKDYHQTSPETQKLDATKRCAFLVKWILKFKPINIVRPPRLSDDDPGSLDQFELINEDFAIFLAEVHMSEDLGLDFEFSELKRTQIMYDMVYREIGADGWMAFFQLVKDCSPNFAECAFIETV
tara:strand:- start:1075 stop:1686 length:612 start_codon:yes stop_codon:yes gene_type:complete